MFKHILISSVKCKFYSMKFIDFVANNFKHNISVSFVAIKVFTDKMEYLIGYI